VYGGMFEKNHNLPGYDVGSVWNSTKLNDHTHTALLLNVKPIVKDTAESLLREIIKDHEALCGIEGRKSEWPLYHRARKLLEGK